MAAEEFEFWFHHNFNDQNIDDNSLFGIAHAAWDAATELAVKNFTANNTQKPCASQIAFNLEGYANTIDEMFPKTASLIRESVRQLRLL